MATSVTQGANVSIAPNPIRLHELVALDEGYFEEQGLTPFVEWQAFIDIMGAWGEYKDRPQDKPFAEQKGNEVASACAWGSINNAASGMGRWVKDAYAVSRHGIYVRPDSPIKEPKDLANVEIAVGPFAGSHFNTYLRLEPHMALDEIKALPVGGYGRRLDALLKGEVEAASIQDPQIFMAEELGLRKIVGGEYDCLWWVDDELDAQVIIKVFKALERAEQALQSNLSTYLPLWEKCIPPEFRDREWHVDTWGQGTRFVFEPYSDEKFETTMAQIERWGLDMHMQSKDLASTARICY